MSASAQVMHRVLLIFMSSTDLAQMRHLASGLSDEGDFEFFTCALGQGKQVFRHGIPEHALSQGRPPHLVEHAGLTTVESAEKSRFGSRLFGTLKTSFRSHAHHEPLASFRLLRRVFLDFLYWRQYRLEAERFLAANRIDSVITCNDYTLQYLPTLKAAELLKIPVILARSANIYFHERSDGYRNSVKHGMRARMPEMHVDQADCFARGVVNWIIRRFAPTHIDSTIWGRLVAYDTASILSLAMAGIRAPHFWHLGMSWTKYIVVSGDDEIKALKSYGIPDNKILPIGCVPFETVNAALKNRDSLRAGICRNLGLDQNKPLILFTIPAGWEHRMWTHEQQFSYLRTTFTLLAQFDANVVIALHPLSVRQDYQELATQFSLAFLDGQLIDSIAIADIFLGADNSSVLRWAMAIGIPTMNFQHNPHSVRIDLPEDYPNIVDPIEFTKWLAYQIARSPIKTDELLAQRQRPMNLISTGKFYKNLADALLP
jgi:hypothetical protein